MPEELDLTQKKCKPCEIGTPALGDNEIKKLLPKISGWELQENKKLKKEFKFKDFLGSMDFVNKIARVAESEGHHPNIFISYNKVRITLTTHASAGLTENDFIMAAKIDEIIS